MKYIVENDFIGRTSLDAPSALEAVQRLKCLHHYNFCTDLVFNVFDEMGHYVATVDMGKNPPIVSH